MTARQRRRRKRVRRWLSRAHRPAPADDAARLRSEAAQTAAAARWARAAPPKPKPPKEAAPWGLVTWRRRDLAMVATFHETRADAMAAAPADGSPFSIVDISRKARVTFPTTGELLSRGRRVSVQPNTHHGKSKWLL